MRRWIYAIVGIVVMLLAGLIYAWTMFQTAIQATFPTWSSGQLSLTYTLMMIAFCIGGIVGGTCQKRGWSIRILLIASAILFAAGFVTTSQTTSLPVLYLGYSVLLGFPSGLAYNAVMSAMMPWFPERQGLISGLLLMAFGMGGFVFGKLFAALTPADGGDGWRSVFLTFAIILPLIVLVSGFILKKPRPDQMAENSSSKSAVQASYEEVTTSQMLRRRNFWLYFVWTTVLSGVGFAIMSQGAPLTLQTAPEMALSTVATIAGLLSIANGVGRILAGVLFDKIDYKATMLIGCAGYAVGAIFFALALTTHSVPALVVACVIFGASCGFIPPLNSAFISLFFGARNYPTNYPIINLNILIASFGSAIAGVVYDMTSTYVPVMVATVIMAAVGTAITLAIRKPVGAR